MGWEAGFSGNAEPKTNHKIAFRAVRSNSVNWYSAMNFSAYWFAAHCESTARMFASQNNSSTKKLCAAANGSLCGAQYNGYKIV